MDKSHTTCLLQQVILRIRRPANMESFKDSVSQIYTLQILAVTLTGSGQPYTFLCSGVL